MNIRMLPIGTTFSKFKRLVRDLSGGAGQGDRADDRGRRDGAGQDGDRKAQRPPGPPDPEQHRPRDRTPEVRDGAGKPRQGTVHLSADHSGANVFIRIRDDGAGLDSEAIRAKAVERGMIPPDAALSEKEIFALIFAPGFSTAKEVTNVSGRGRRHGRGEEGHRRAAGIDRDREPARARERPSPSSCP